MFWTKSHAALALLSLRSLTQADILSNAGFTDLVAILSGNETDATALQGTNNVPHTFCSESNKTVLVPLMAVWKKPLVLVMESNDSQLKVIQIIQ